MPYVLGGPSNLILPQSSGIRSGYEMAVWQWRNLKADSMGGTDLGH